MSLTALVVDDSKDIRLALSDFLEMLGIKIVAQAANGKEAVEQYAKFRPDIVFLDIMMPKYDGFYALEEIRKINPKAKVLIVTANPSVDVSNRAQKLGAIGIIQKPFDLESIKKSIAQITQKKD
ncbi:MAG: response regulator [Nitrososphaerota archaeon]